MYILTNSKQIGGVCRPFEPTPHGVSNVPT